MSWNKMYLPFHNVVMTYSSLNQSGTTLKPPDKLCGSSLYHQGFSESSSGSCALGAGASMDWVCSNAIHGCSIGLGYWEFGGWVDTFGPLLCSLSCWWAVFTVWPSGSAFGLGVQWCSGGWCVSNSIDMNSRTHEWCLTTTPPLMA